MGAAQSFTICLYSKTREGGEEGVTVRPLAPVVSCALSRSEGQWSLPSRGEKIHSFTELLLEMAFHAQGHERTCRTTPFPSATCPWVSISSYQQPLYLSSLSLSRSDRTQCFPPASGLPLVMLQDIDFNYSSELFSQMGFLLISQGGRTTKEQRGKRVSM